MCGVVERKNCVKRKRILTLFYMSPTQEYMCICFCGGEQIL